MGEEEGQENKPREESMLGKAAFIEQRGQARKATPQSEKISPHKRRETPPNDPWKLSLCLFVGLWKITGMGK